jgi:hypothetical protein
MGIAIYIGCQSGRSGCRSPATKRIKCNKLNKFFQSRVEEGSNTSTVALRVMGGEEKETQCLRA